MPTSTYEDNVARRRGTHIIPKDWLKPAFTFEIKYRGDSDYTDITEDVIYVTTMLAATEAMPAFNADIDNNEGKYKGKILGGEWIRIKYGYTGTGNDQSTMASTIERFRGRLSSAFVSFSPLEGWKMSLKGMSYPEFNERNITISFHNIDIEEAIAQVIAEYPDMRFTKPAISTDTVTQTFMNETGFSIVRQLCERFELECFINPNGSLTVLKSEDNKHTDCGIGMGQNLMSIEEWGTDWKDLKNKVKIHGKQEDYVVYYKFDEDTASQSNFWVKEKDIYDSKISSDVEAIQLAEKELGVALISEEGGRVSTVGMPEVIVGHEIYLSCPYVAEGYYTVRSVSHRFEGEGGYITYFTLTTERKTEAHLFAERIRAEQGLRPPQALDAQTDDAMVVDFQPVTTPYLTYSNTEVVAKKLYLETGKTSGTCITASDFPGRITTHNTASCYVVASGTNLENCTFEVSNNNGLNYTKFIYTELLTNKTFAGSDNEHKIRITLADNDQGNKPVLNKVGVYLVNT